MSAISFNNLQIFVVVVVVVVVVAILEKTVKYGTLSYPRYI